MKQIIFILFSLFSSSLFAHDINPPPKELWQQVNGGWEEPYASLFDHLDSQKNYVIWTIIAPKDPIDLRKPDYFKQFISRASSKENFSISHNLVGWHCQLPDGRFYMGATGQSGEISGQSAELVKAGYGLTTFMAKFTDGWLSDSFFTGEIITERGNREEIYSLVVEVSSRDCANMLDFLKSYILHPRKPYKNFGLTLNPEKYEGAGCISFAAALMKKAGVFSEVFNKSTRSLWASHYRFGGNDLPVPENTVMPRLSWREGKPKKVSINEFFSANWNAGLQGVNLKLNDPELLVWGFKSLSPRLSQNPRTVIEMPTSDCQLQGMNCQPKHVKVNDSYDKQAAQVSAAARSWKKKMANKGYRMKEVMIQGKPFLIFSAKNKLSK